MKLSTKILIGFFGFIFLYLTAAFAEIRLTGIPNVINNKNSIAETVDLSGGITHLVLSGMDNRLVKIIGSDRAQLEVRSLSGDLLKKLSYEISGDTLTVSDFEEDENKRVQITVFVPDARLKGITVKSSTASVEGLQQQRLYISENAGRVWLSENTIEKIEIALSDKSLLDISTTTLDTVSAIIEESQVHISSPVRLVQGSIKDESLLRLSEILEIQLTKDKSSKLTVYQ